jgi:uncharacterized protein YabE (DUF348 family)
LISLKRASAQHLLGRLLIAGILLVLVSCQPQTTQTPITILDGNQVYTLATAERLPSKLLAEANISLSPADRLLYLGAAIPLNQPLPEARSYTLQIRRATTLTLVTPDGQQTLQTSALTIGQALAEAGIPLYAADRLDPPAGTPILGSLTVNYTPSREYSVSLDGKSVVIRSAAATVGQALAEAGIPLLGLDYSLPVESAPLPEDRQIRLIRVVETVMLTQESIPFTTLSEYSADMELDQQAITQSGSPGLAVSRVRLRSEDGLEVSRHSESESIVRPPQDRVVSYGTRVDMHTAAVNGITITYWRALQFWATSYHPAETGSDMTASGLHLQKGVVAIDPDYIPYFTQMYVPGYGFAEAADTGSIIGRWIDLGYSDDDYVAWHQWVTVYFLWPPPVTIPYNVPPPTTTWGLIPPPP